MAEVTLRAEPSRATGSSVSRRLRNSGKVPAVIYGHGMDPLHVAVVGRELRAALNTDAGFNALLTLDVGGTRHTALTREVQRHPVRGTVDHVDFLVVNRDEKITAEVPVHLVGEARAVSNNDGVLNQEAFTITVSAPADRIPESIDIDVSDLEVGDSIRMGDVVLPEGVTTEVDAEEPLVVATGSSVSADAAEIEAGDAEVAEAQAAESEADGGDTGPQSSAANEAARPSTGSPNAG